MARRLFDAPLTDGRPPLEWRKSSHSFSNGNCVEVAGDEAVWVRDSKDPDGPWQQFTREQWQAFTRWLTDPAAPGPAVWRPDAE